MIRFHLQPSRLPIALAAALIGTSGCMVGPNYTPPETPMPATYGELRNVTDTSPQGGSPYGPIDIRWWRRFDDERLTGLVEKAVVANFEISAAAARLREARAARHIAQSLLYPQISVGASALHFRASGAVFDLPGLDLEDNLFQLGFDASWVVDVFGRTRRSVESAEAQEQAVAALRRGVVLMVAAETARAYLELRGTQREFQIASTTLAQQRQTLGVTQDKFKNGLASDLELMRARTEVESTAAQIPPLQQAGRQYIHVLSTLLGLEPTALAPDLEKPSQIPQPSHEVAVGIPSDLLRRRPDVQEAERQLAAATAQVGVATAQLFPQLVLGGSGGFQSKKFDDLFNGNGGSNSSIYYLAGPSINWTLFDGGRRKAGIELSEAQVDAAKAAYEDTVLRAFREVESSIVAVDRTQENLKNLRRLSASAGKSAYIARNDYERGILDQLTVLDAERQANRADMLLAQGEVALAVNVVALYKAVGGGWEIAEPSMPGQQETVTKQ